MKANGKINVLFWRFNFYSFIWFIWKMSHLVSALVEKEMNYKSLYNHWHNPDDFVMFNWHCIILGPWVGHRKADHPEPSFVMASVWIAEGRLDSDIYV